jgi:carboxyl-terminal processing protease
VKLALAGWLRDDVHMIPHRVATSAAWPRRIAAMALATLLALASIAPFAQAQPAPVANPSAGKAAADKQPAPDTAADGTPAAASDGSVPIDDIKRYVAVYRVVKQAYVDKVSDRKLMQASIRGLLNDLDPHSAYLDKEESEQLDQDTNGAYQGIGVEVMQLPDRSLRVVSPIDDTPAARAGIKAGDVIVAINGLPIDAESADSASIGLRGEPGTQVKLKVLREGAAAPLLITVTRDVIKIESVRTRMLEPGYGYVRLSAFQIDTAADMQQQLAALVKQNHGPLRGLVLDLRSNPGGLLNAAVEVADAFLDSGVIVTTKGRLPYANAVYTASPGDALNGAPIVVLVDGGTASASEVLAGALHDDHRARIVGSRTFGKGSVQSVLPLDNGDSIKLTTARYYTPSGKSIQARGIRPDVLLAVDKPRATDGDGLSERDLPKHLGAADDSAVTVEDGGSAVVYDDAYAIAAGLKELKAMGAAAPAPAKPASR